jgi:hypothetical protein
VSFHFPFRLWAHARAREQVDDACPLATMAALSLDAKQARKAEWYTAYPKVRPNGRPKHDAIRRRAKALPSLPLHEGDSSRAGAGAGALRHLGAREFSAFAAITCSAVGSGRATMSMIADVARQELRWQLHVMQPLCIGLPIPTPTPIDDGDEDKAAADSERRRGLLIPGCPVSTRALSPELVVAGAAAHVPAAHLDGLHGHMSGRKRKRSAATETEVAGAPDSARPPPEKRAKRGSGDLHRDDPSHVYRRGRSGRGTRGAVNASHHEGSPKAPTGPAAAFLYALGMQSAARERTVVERRRGAGKWR